MTPGLDTNAISMIRAGQGMALGRRATAGSAHGWWPARSSGGSSWTPSRWCGAVGQVGVWDWVWGQLLSAVTLLRSHT